MGSARSGTSILYRLLVMTGRFNYVSAYHLIQSRRDPRQPPDGTTEAAKKRLEDRFREVGITGARFDGTEVSPDFPEEYGFHLGARQQLTPKTLPRFLELCRKVTFTSGAGRPILLKNPWDARRFPYIKAVLPESRFIFIHRNPADVALSTLDGFRSPWARATPTTRCSPSYDRLMRQPLRRTLARALFTPRFGLGARVVNWQVSRMARYFVDHIGSLAENDYLSVRYEDLCQDPDTIMPRILTFLGLPASPEVRYRDYIRHRPRPRSARGDGDSSAILRRLELKPYLTYCGYEAK
jgi:hypothetical protein